MGRGRFVWLSVFLVATAMLLFACEKGMPPGLMAAEEAVAAAKAEGANDLCPDEYASAELKLKQAQLLYADNEDQKADLAASEAELLGKAALDCAVVAKQPKSIEVGDVPQALLDAIVSVFFEFNKNNLTKESSNAVKALATALIPLQQQDIDFWVLIETHADRPGTPEANLEITTRRAKVVRYILTQYGVTEDHIVMRPKGEMLADKEVGETNSKKALNKKEQKFRRADITIHEDYPE